jgi:hypothetical protein
MDFVTEIKIKYPFIKNTADIVAIVNKAKMFYYGAKYPCEPNVNEETRPITTFFGQQWILSACDELIERLGFSSAVGYAENSVRWTFDNAHLSDRLMNLITPNIGVL